MAITTYSELQAAVTNWLARDDLASRIPEFIALAEAKLNRMVMHPKMETRTTMTVDTGATSPEFLSLPTDFQTMRSARLSGVAGKPRLSYMARSQMDDYRYSIDNVSDQPIFFTIVGTEMELAPTPNEDYDVEVVYRANLSALASNSTNWLLTFAPDVYLYGALLEAAAYTKNDQRVGLWSEAFAAALDQLNTHGHRQAVDAGPSEVWLPGVTP